MKVITASTIGNLISAHIEGDEKNFSHMQILLQMHMTKQEKSVVLELLEKG